MEIKVENEEFLFKILAEQHLAMRGVIGIRNIRWVVSEASGKYYSEYTDDAETGRWIGTRATVDAILTRLIKLRESLDSVGFFMEKWTDGVTWRMLKIDMPYLRVMLKDDKHVMPNTIRRLSAVITEVMQKEEDPEEEE